MPTPTDRQLIAQLREVHALAQEGLTQRREALESAENAALRQALKEPLVQIEEHERLLAARLAFYDEPISTLTELAHRAHAAIEGTVSRAGRHSDIRLATQAYGFAHLQIANDRVLRVAAQRADDAETDAIAKRLLADHKAAADTLKPLVKKVAHDELQRTLAGV